MELTIIETSAYQDLKKQLSMLSVQMMDFQKKIAPVTPDKWLDAQDVCLALNISKRALQTYRDNGTIPYTQINHKMFYKPKDVDKVLKRLRNQNQPINK